MLKKALIFSIILSSLLSLAGNVGMAAHTASGQAKIDQESSEQPAGPTIVVTESFASSESILIQSSVVGSNSVACAWPNFLGQNLVQDQGQINLNQPATCFRLVQGVAVAQNALDVMEAESASRVAVSQTNNTPVLARDSVMPGTSDSTLPQGLPMAVAIGLTFTLVEIARRGIIKINKSGQSYNLLSLPQLGVMRC